MEEPQHPHHHFSMYKCVGGREYNEIIDLSRLASSFLSGSHPVPPFSVEMKLDFDLSVVASVSSVCSSGLGEVGMLNLWYKREEM